MLHSLTAAMRFGDLQSWRGAKYGQDLKKVPRPGATWGPSQRARDALSAHGRQI